MGALNDSINAKITPKVHSAINDTVMDLLAIFEALGVDTETEIDFDPGTGEPQMTEKTLRAIAKVKKEMREKNLMVDKVIMSEDPTKSGYYVIQGRVITPGGVIVSEGECVGFVPLVQVTEDTPVDGEMARGVLV